MVFKNSLRGCLLATLLVQAVLFEGAVYAAACAPSADGNVCLTDDPLGTQTKVPPTLMMTVDDSSSMTWQHTPDDIDEVSAACWTAAGVATRCTSGASTIFQNGEPPMMANALNRLAYNPLLTYLPPRQADGSYLPDMSSANTNNWKNVVWPGSWSGRPGVVNLNTAAVGGTIYAYTQAQMDVLKTRYMRGLAVADPIWNLFVKTGSGSNTRYVLPPHYYKTNVKWCRSTRASGDLSGSAEPGASFSNCQDERDSTYQYPFYYTSGNTDNLNAPAFELVVLDVSNPHSYSHQYFDEETGATATLSRSFDEEMTNYANWAAYYRNRLAATKTVASHAFAEIDTSAAAAALPRVGFATINTLAGTAVGAATRDPAPFVGTAKNNFFNSLLTFTYTGGGTPLQQAANEIGRKFRDNSDYIIHSCQRNYNILFTDGLWNQVAYYTNRVGNQDDTLKVNLPEWLPEGTDIYGRTNRPLNAREVLKDHVAPVYGPNALLNGQPWPRPIRDAKAASTDTLADIALYYWMTDLRSGAGMENNVIYTNKDPATWQHLNFVGMGFGVRGRMPAADQTRTLNEIIAGTRDWPTPTNDNVTAVDDLWHASVNGFGRYVSAASADEFRAGLRSILHEILNLGGARSGAGVSNTNLTGGSSHTYSVSFSPGWNGDIVKKNINAQGKESSISGQNTAASKLAELLTVTVSTPEPWVTERKIFTRTAAEYGPTYAVPFSFGSLSSDQLNTLGTNATRQKNVIAYLRGDRSREGDALGRLRVRGKGPLGDIVNAKPIVVTTPSCVVVDKSEDTADGKKDGFACQYNEKNNEGYAAFFNDHKSRSTMVYVGANDGMLHAFDGNLNEKWGYIPLDLFRTYDEGGLVNLTYQEANEKTPFVHRAYVDATPRVFDVRVGKEWRTMLVGGLGKGGTSYYALDVTDVSDVGSETAAPNKSKWEFSDPNMGYTYGRAILTKTNSWDSSFKNVDGKFEKEWVAILPSGFNNGAGNGQPKNGDGKGRIFFVDLRTGKKLHEIETPEGTPEKPVELVHIGGYVEDGATDQLTTAVYGGDQQGNLWRFNLEDADHKNWTVEKIAILKDKSGNRQWVTTEPWPQLDSEGYRFVFVGTGGFRVDADLESKVGHTMYAFRDGNKAKADTFTSRNRGDLIPISGADPSLNGTEKKKMTDFGWYQDMASGYHITVNPAAAYNNVVYASNKYEGNVAGGGLAGKLCDSSSFTGMLYAREMADLKTSLNTGNEFMTVKQGIADITLVSKKINGEDVLSFVITALDGTGVVQDDDAFIKVKGNGTLEGVPIRANIRYIN